MPLSMVKRSFSDMPKRSPIHGKKCVRLKCRPRTPLGMPVEPEVKESVPTESGPIGMPTGSEALSGELSRTSDPLASRPPCNEPSSCSCSAGTSHLICSYIPCVLIRGVGSTCRQWGWPLHPPARLGVGAPGCTGPSQGAAERLPFPLKRGLPVSCCEGSGSSLMMVGYIAISRW